MSIKTSKRIALGVITALVFAPFAAIAPANANTGATVFDPLQTQVFVPVGQTAIIPVIITSVEGTAANVNQTIIVTPTTPATEVIINTADATATNLTAANGRTVAATGTGALTATPAGDFTAATKALTDGRTLGNIRVTPTAIGSYTVTLTATTGGGGNLTFAAAAKTVTVTAIAAQPATLTATVLGTAVGDTINKVGVDTPTIQITRPAGQPTSAGALSLEVISAPNVTQLPIGAVIRAGALTPGTGVVFTTIVAPFGTSYRLPNTAAAGLYQFKAFVDANANNLRDASEASLDVELRIVGVPTRAVVTLDGSTTVNGAVNRVFNATVTLTDIGGFPTYAPADITLAISSVVTATGVAGAGGATDDVAAANIARIGTSNTYRATVTRTGTADSDNHTFTITPACNVGGGAACTTNTVATFTVTDVTLAATATRLALASQTGLFFGAVGAASYTTVIPANTATATAVAVTADPAVTTFGFTLTGTAAKVYTVTTTPGANMTLSRIAAPTTVTTLADGLVTFTVTVTTPTVTLTTADSFTINVAGVGNNFSYAVTYANPVASWTLNPAAAPFVLEKSANKVTAKLTDSYGRVLGNTGYTVAVTGRNVSASTGVTDASGNAEFTLRDSATTSYALVGGFPTDTVTFTNVGTVALPAVSRGVTYTYKATLAAVGTVTVTVAAANRVIDQVEALAGTPANTAVATYTATVRTAAGAAVGAGTLVTFAGGTGDLFVDGITSGVTNANGQATANVYRQKVGFAAITATANTVLGAAQAILWVNGGQDAAVGATAFGDHRNVKVSAAQTVVPGSAATVVATVTDRWGNAVSNITVTFSLAGAGRIVTGETLTKRTDINGSAQVQVTSLATETGVNTVTATISGGQTLDLAGFVRAAAIAGDAAIAAGVATGQSATASRVAGVVAGNRTASGTVAFTAPVVVAPVVPTVVVPPVAPTLSAERQGNRVLLFGTCMVDEGDIIIYVKSPGKAYSEKAKTLECADGEYDGSLRASKNTKFYRVKQEGTGLYSTSKLIRP